MKTYKEAVFESDELQRQQIRDAHERGELNQEEIERIYSEAKKRLHSIYLLFYPNDNTRQSL